LAQPAAFKALCQKAGRVEWVVYAKPLFGGPEQVLKYLARYTHRVAISNRRVLSMEEGRVKFEWKDYAAGNQTQPDQDDDFGFLANRKRKVKLALCQSLLSAPQTLIQARSDSLGGGGDTTTQEH
jgi:Putative transposase